MLNEYVAKLIDLISNCDHKNLYVTKQDCVLFVLLIKSLTVKGVGEFSEGKIFKCRLTVLLCGNMIGDMQKRFMIEKATKLRCFKTLKFHNIQVAWRNKKRKCRLKY